MNRLDVQICESYKEAPNYRENGEGFKGAKLIKAIIVKKGTEGGFDTVDLQFEDEDGTKYVAMTTGALLKTVTDLVNANAEKG